MATVIHRLHEFSEKRKIVSSYHSKKVISIKNQRLKDSLVSLK